MHLSLAASYPSRAWPVRPEAGERVAPTHDHDRERAELSLEYYNRDDDQVGRIRFRGTAIDILLSHSSKTNKDNNPAEKEGMSCSSKACNVQIAGLWQSRCLWKFYFVYLVIIYIHILKYCLFFVIHIYIRLVFYVDFIYLGVHNEISVIASQRRNEKKRSGLSTIITFPAIQR